MGSKPEIGRGEKQNKKFCLGMESGAASTLLAEVVARQWRDAHKEPKMVGEALKTKGRNPIELRGIKRRRGSRKGQQQRGETERRVRKKLRTREQKEN